jgi:hypothetical protein
MGIKQFFKNAFSDMKASAKAQHEVDKANFAAAKAESKATWEEAKLSPKARQEMMQREREKQIEEAKARTAAANERIDAAKSAREGK